MDQPWPQAPATPGSAFCRCSLKSADSKYGLLHLCHAYGIITTLRALLVNVHLRCVSPKLFIVSHVSGSLSLPMSCASCPCYSVIELCPDIVLLHWINHFRNLPCPNSPFDLQRNAAKSSEHVPISCVMQECPLPINRDKNNTMPIFCGATPPTAARLPEYAAGMFAQFSAYVVVRLAA